jgi:hypothetical protein
MSLSVDKVSVSSEASIDEIYQKVSITVWKTLMINKL